MDNRKFYKLGFKGATGGGFYTKTENYTIQIKLQKDKMFKIVFSDKQVRTITRSLTFDEALDFAVKLRNLLNLPALKH